MTKPRTHHSEAQAHGSVLTEFAFPCSTDLGGETWCTPAAAERAEAWALVGTTVPGMTLGDLVVGTAHVCGPDTSLEDAASAMRAAGHGSLGVVEGGALIGLLTERDLVAGLASGLIASDFVRRVMTPEPDVFAPSVDVFEAAQWLLESGYRHLPVVESGRLLGVVSVTDVLSAVLESVELDDDEEG